MLRLPPKAWDFETEAEKLEYLAGVFESTTEAQAKQADEKLARAKKPPTKRKKAASAK
jgi:hypothetical protein